MNNKSTILSIAGSDSSAGAGIQADLKTISSLGGYGLTVITLITAQNTQGVQDVYPLPLSIIEQQIDSVFSDIKVDSVKLGALYNDVIIKLVARKLAQYNVKNIVLDPVIFSKNMSALLKEDAIFELKETLIPMSIIVTPNIPEAEVLTNIPIKNKTDMEQASLKLLSLGCQSVLIKGGHLNIEDKAIDCLILNKNDITFLENKKIDTQNTHGTGCTLSSAIATFLAKNFSIKSSVEKAKNYISLAIEAAKSQKIGHGHGPVEHFFNIYK
jgi:hydroxymethylpyrimidine/phosphomethylpyrimidine kinase